MAASWLILAAVMSARDQLARYLTPGLELPEIEHFRFHDAPPQLVREVLSGLDPLWISYRPNGQPPAAWLLATAERLDGLVAGSSSHPNGLRVDAICVPGDRAADLAGAVERDWPERAIDERALDLALAEAWPSWDAERPVWEGSGRDLLAGRSEPVVGLWWD